MNARTMGGAHMPPVRELGGPFKRNGVPGKRRRAIVLGVKKRTVRFWRLLSRGRFAFSVSFSARFLPVFFIVYIVFFVLDLGAWNLGSGILVPGTWDPFSACVFLRFYCVLCPGSGGLDPGVYKPGSWDLGFWGLGTWEA